MQNQRKSGVILSYVVLIFNIAIGLLYVPILLHYMSQSEYGLYRLLGSIMVYFAMMELGLGTVVTRFYTRYRALRETVHVENTLALALMIFAGISIVIASIGGTFYFYLPDVFAASFSGAELFKAQKIYLLLLFNLLLIILGNLFNALITSHEKFIFLKGITLLQIALQPFLIIQVMRVSPEAFHLVLVQTVCNIVFVLIKAGYCFQYLQIKVKYHYFDRKILRSMGTLSGSLFLVAIFDQVYWQGNQVILGVISGTLAVAVYSIAVQIYMGYLPMAAVFMQVFLPRVTEMAVQGAAAKDFSALFIRVGRLQFILLAAVLTGFALYGEMFIRIWAGETYLDAYVIALLIMGPFTINLIQTMGVVILQAKNQYGFRALTYVGVGVLNLLLAIPMAKAYGGIGCAAVTGCCYLLGDGLIMNIYYSRVIHLEIGRFWREILRLGVVVLCAFILGMGLNYTHIFSDDRDFLVRVLCYSILYIGLMWKYGFNESEKLLVISGYQKVREKVCSSR